MKCQRCGVENPEGKNYCGDCGSPLSGNVDNSHVDSSNVYVKYGGPDDHFLWIGTMTMTKSQYMIRLAIFVIALLLLLPLIFVAGGLVCGTVFLLVMFDMVYFFWLIGRVGADRRS